MGLSVDCADSSRRLGAPLCHVPRSTLPVLTASRSSWCASAAACSARLSGHVHAGCTGDRSAAISALELRGAQLVIAHSTSLGAARVRRPQPLQQPAARVSGALEHFDPGRSLHPTAELYGACKDSRAQLTGALCSRCCHCCHCCHCCPGPHRITRSQSLAPTRHVCCRQGAA